MKMTRISKLFTAFAAITATAGLSAMPINGSLIYNLDESDFAFTNSAVSFVGTANGKVNNVSGNLAGLGLTNTTVQHSDVVYDPFAGPIAPLVTAAGFSFNLTSLTSFDFTSGESSFLNLVGKGWASMTGFDDTMMSWTFAATDSTDVINYSATLMTAPMTVPDGGTTLTLLGLAIGVILTVSRRRNLRGRQLALR